MATALIVGSNRGIGLEITRQLAGRGDTVIAACRESSEGLRALDVETIEGIDITSDEGVRQLVDALGERNPDLVFVVAGVLERTGLDDLDFDLIRRQMEVNALGPLRVVAALRPRLRPGARVGLLTSRMGSIEDNTSGSHYGYRMSKAALNMAGRSLALDLAGAGVAVALLHPGFVRTDMTGGAGNIDAPEAAAGLIARIDELTAETSGHFWHQSGEELPW